LSVRGTALLTGLSTAVRRPPDRGEVEEIVAVTPVKADHLMANGQGSSGKPLRGHPRDRAAR